ncbi:MAG TPA: hypothetical protein DEV93_06145 [Chloroflexi bacterium]|jgi:hypothetical protein|nr:hypothetical protein [Chloroflexota bacterium]
MPDLHVLVPGIVGGFVGAIGWLFVGLYIQRRQYMRQAKNAARAVYFEIDMNRVVVQAAREYGSGTSLSRASFDRLLPELATSLRPEELQTIVTAYLAHVGYDQANTDSRLPPELRRQAMTGILDSQEKAQQLLRRRVFSQQQAHLLDQQLRTSDEPGEKDGGGSRRAATSKVR